MEDRGGVAELLRGEVGDRLAADVGDAHAQREAVDERPDDDVAPLLGLLGVDVVEVQRVVVHGDQAEQVVVRLGDRLGRPVLVDVTDLEFLEVAPVGMPPARFALGLVGGEGVGFGAHDGRECAARRLYRAWPGILTTVARLAGYIPAKRATVGTNGIWRGLGRRRMGSCGWISSRISG